MGGLTTDRKEPRKKLYFLHKPERWREKACYYDVHMKKKSKILFYYLSKVFYFWLVISPMH